MNFLPDDYMERRRAQFAREYRAKLSTSPVYALSKLLYLNILTDEDIAEASKHNLYKVRGWAHAHLGAGDYSEADEGMPIEERFA